MISFGTITHTQNTNPDCALYFLNKKNSPRTRKII
jgi:hypothetical protein